jgi:hypothetical protein
VHKQVNGNRNRTDPDSADSVAAAPSCGATHSSFSLLVVEGQLQAFIGRVLCR